MTDWDVAREFERLSTRREWAMSVGNRFAEQFSRLRRAGRGGSQQHIALTMALIYGHKTWHQTTVAKVEAGERDVKLAEAVALAEILNVNLSDLIGEPSSEQEASDGKHPEEA